MLKHIIIIIRSIDRGGLAVFAILGLAKEERIKVLAKALKLTNETATSLVNQFYEEDHYDLFDD